MRSSIFIALFPLLAVLARAQTLSNGRLIIYTPTELTACEAANIQWVWTGNQDDLVDNTVQIAVEQQSENFRRSLAEASPIRKVRRKSQLHSRDIAINIAGGSNIPMSQQQWTWNSVGVPEGTYRMALTIQGQGYTGYSSTFTVSQGEDTSCLGGSGAGVPTTTALVQTSTAPGEVVSTAAPQSTNQTTSPAPAITSTSAPSSTSTSNNSAPTFKAESDSGKNGSSNKGPSGGAVAAAVIIPLIVAGVLLAFCMRRKKAAGQPISPDWSEKFTGLLGGGNRSNKEHRRQISTPMDPVHAAGMAMHEQAIKTQMRQANDVSGAVTQTPEHWVDFNPDVQESDARLVSPSRVDDMVRASMEVNNSSLPQHPFYQQGANEALRQSTSTSMQRSTMTTESDGNSTLPSYLRDADFTSYHTHSSFGHDVNGAPVGHLDDATTLKRSSTQRSNTLERSESKVRRKPVPTYSTLGVSQAAGQSSSTVNNDDASPFSDVHGIATSAYKSHEDMISSSNHSVHDGSLHEILKGDQEVVEDSPTLGVSPALLHTPASMSGEFPVSVHGSPAGRVLLNTPRGSLTDEEDKKETYKLSIAVPKEDRGFRVSF
jgi:hypothetical protein